MLPRILEFVRLLFQLRQFRVCQVKRNPNDRLARRASPLVRQVASGTKLFESLRHQFAIELLDEPLHRRSLELQPQFANRPAQ